MFRSLAQTVKNRRIPPGRILALFLGLFLSCKQDAIFFHISQEVEPKDPRIEGSPSKVVKFGAALYVANGRLHRYTQGSGTPGDRGTWDSPLPLEQPPGGARDLAAANGFLYAITGNKEPGSFRLYRSVDGDNWPDTAPMGTTDGGLISLPPGYAPQTIHSANNTLFIGAYGGSTNYAIFYLNASDNPVKLETFTGDTAPGGVLRGALYDGSDYYLATATKGIFSYTSLPSSDTGNVNAATNRIADSHTKGEFFSLISANTKHFAVGPGIWEVNGPFGSANTPLIGAGGSFKGSAFWPKVGTSPSDLLLLGTHGSGYFEVSVDSSGTLTNLKAPGGAASSIPHGNTNEYSAMLDEEAINYLYVLTELSGNGDPVIFASTHREGLWSYRNGEWNYED
jgi:hypothetical protein